MITAIATITLLKIAPIASSPSFPQYNIKAACSHVTDISGGEFTNPIDRCQKDETNAKCRVPDDCIDPRRMPLFTGRAFFRDLITRLQARQSGELQP